MECGIMRCEKRKAVDCKGIQRENNRDHQTAQNSLPHSDIDWEKTPQNFFFKKSRNLHSDITRILKANGIDKWRKDAVFFIDTIYTASPDFFKGKDQQEILTYFQKCLEFHSKEFGYLVNAVVHFDEKTPHMHVVSVPIVEKDGVRRLSAKDLMGGITEYHRRQDRFFESVSKEYGLERGESTLNAKEKRTHKDKLQYEIEQAQAILDTQKEQIEQNQAKIDLFDDLDARIQSQRQELHSLDISIKSKKAEESQLKQQITPLKKKADDLMQFAYFMGNPNTKEAKQIKRLERMLDQKNEELKQRDDFIKQRGLWEEFEASLQEQIMDAQYEEDTPSIEEFDWD